MICSSEVTVTVLQFCIQNISLIVVMMANLQRKNVKSVKFTSVLLRFIDTIQYTPSNKIYIYIYFTLQIAHFCTICQQQKCFCHSSTQKHEQLHLQEVMVSVI